MSASKYYNNPFPERKKTEGMWMGTQMGQALVMTLDELIEKKKIPQKMKESIMIHFDTIATECLRGVAPRLKFTARGQCGMKDLGGVITSTLLNATISVKGFSFGDLMQVEGLDKLPIKLYPAPARFRAQQRIRSKIAAAVADTKKEVRVAHSQKKRTVRQRKKLSQENPFLAHGEDLESGDELTEEQIRTKAEEVMVLRAFGIDPDDPNF